MQTLLWLLQRLWHFRSALATMFFVIVVGFLDNYSFLHVFRLWQKNRELQADVEKYKKEYNADTHQLYLLETSPEAIEKVARVNLLMKTADEDVYVIVEE